MAITIEEKKTKTKEKRSQAISGKISLLKTRDGSEHPPIESQMDIDDFNLNMLYGLSGNETIDWEHVGIEGLVRIYYQMIEYLSGKTRNNIIKNVDYSGTRSSLDRSAEYLIEGTGYISGFFKGWIAGQDGHDSDASDTLKGEGIAGVFDETSSSFLDNRDQIKVLGIWQYPDDNPNNLSTKLSEALSIAGVRSPLHSGGWDGGETQLNWTTLLTTAAVNDNILGRRFTDIVPETFQDNDPDPDTYEYGNGVYDTTNTNAPYGFNHNVERNFYDDTLHTRLNEIKTLCDNIITFINYSKIDDETYFTNPNPIFGRDEAPQWTTQDVWIGKLNDIKTAIDTYITAVTPYYTPGAGTTDPAGMTDVNNALDQLVTDLGLGLTEVTGINTTIDSDTFFGDITNPNKMRGLRYLLIKTIINTNDGSKTTLKGIEAALEHMNTSITNAEEEFGIYGISRQTVPWATSDAWIEGLRTPDIVGIQIYSTIDTNSANETFGEMINDGYILAWYGTDHATSYEVFKSSDWDGVIGTWVKLLPAGNSYSVEEMDNNSGNIITYYIDRDVDPDIEKPYYKVIAYDTGGVGDYSRIPGNSEESEPKYIDDFLGEGGGSSPYVGPTLPVPAPPGSAPPYLFKWKTILLGSESQDISRTIYRSEAEFDSVGSNLEVFVDGEIVNQGDYSLLNSKDIQFVSGQNPNSEIVLIVYYGGGSGSWKSPVNTESMLPSVGNLDGDVRIVLDTGKIYIWNDGDSMWEVAKSDIGDIEFNHNDLADMEDTYGDNADHDSRYYTENEVDNMVVNLNNQIDALQYLIPEDAAPLAGNMTINTTLYEGYMSSGVGQNFSTLTHSTEYDKLINTNDFTITNPNNDTQFNNADKGVLRLYINDVLVDYFNLEAAFNEGDRATGQTYTPAFGVNNKIEILEVLPYKDYGLYQKGDFKIHISGDLIQGENKIQITHYILGVETVSNEMILFYDDSTDDIEFINIDLDDDTTSSNKYLSGVRHFYLNDSFAITFKAQNVFNNTYLISNQINIDGSELAITPFNINHESDGVVGIVSPSIGEEITYLKVLNMDIPNVYSISPYLRLKGSTPFGEDSEFTSDSRFILINTYPNQSTDKHEYFLDEEYRLPVLSYDSTLINYVGLWDSDDLLGTNDLQVFTQELVYPSLDFSSSYLPNQSVNYSGFSGERSYIRAFVDLGVPHNNGTFYIKSFNILDNNIKITIKLPGQTGWLDLKKLFNEADFTGSNDDGCLTNNNNEYFTWTSGDNSTAYSGYMVLLKVTALNTSFNSIQQISIDW